MAAGTYVLLVLATGLHVARPQGGNTDPRYRNEEYWVDRLADCNKDQEYILQNKEAVIRGPNPNPDNQRGPLSCTIRFKAENNFEQQKIKVKIVEMAIKDTQVKFTIYDGAPEQSVLGSYDINTGNDMAELITSGSSVSFVFQRRDSRTTLYHIEVKVTSLVVGTDPGYENNWGKDYGYFNRQVPNVAIYATVGALFILVVLIIIIVSIVCYRKHQGMDKKPESYKLSYIATNIGTRSRGAVSETSTRNWVNTSRENLRRDQKRRHHDDDDSVFSGSVDSYPEKRYHDHHVRSNHHRSDRHNPRSDSYRNDSFVRGDDDHPQDKYIQREISPRVKRKLKKSEEAGEEEPLDSEEEEESEEDKEVPSSEAEEEEDDEGEDVDAGVPPQAHPQHVPEHPPARDPQPQSYPGDPRQMPVDPRQMPIDPRSLPVGSYGPQFVMYPGQPRPQFVPMAPGPGQFQPIHAPPRAMAPPAYPGQPLQQPAKPYEPKPADPPIYSYLVQRGYNPVDGRDSPVSVSTNASAHSDTRLIHPAPDDHDMSSHNLGTGVEYMRR